MSESIERERSTSGPRRAYVDVLELLLERLRGSWYPPGSRLPAERALALQLLGFAAALEATAETWSPSKLCTYLFELATSFTTFYEACRVLVDDEAVRDSRLGLCDLTARVLELGLSLLGIEAPDQM